MAAMPMFLSAVQLLLNQMIGLERSPSWPMMLADECRAGADPPEPTLLVAA